MVTLVQVIKKGYKQTFTVFFSFKKTPLYPNKKC